MSGYIRMVELVVETGGNQGGETYKLRVSLPKPRGGNPAYAGQQLDNAMDELRVRAMSIIVARLGDQVENA